MPVQSPFASLFPETFVRFIRRDPRASAHGLEPDDVLAELALLVLTSALARPVRGIRLRWLYLDVLRRARRYSARHVVGDVLAITLPEPDAAIEIGTYLRELAPDEIAAVWAVSWLGHTLDEAGRAAGVSAATVHRRLNSARTRCARLRKASPRGPKLRIVGNT